MSWGFPWIPPVQLCARCRMVQSCSRNIFILNATASAVVLMVQGETPVMRFLAHVPTVSTIDWSYER